MPPKGINSTRTQSKRSADLATVSDGEVETPSSPKVEIGSESPRSMMKLLLAIRTDAAEARAEAASVRAMLEAHIKAVSTGGAANATKEVAKRATSDTPYSWFLARIQKDDVLLQALWEGTDESIWPNGRLDQKYMEQFKEMPRASTDADARVKLGRNLWSKLIGKDNHHIIEAYRQKVDPKLEKPKRGSKIAGKAIPETWLPTDDPAAPAAPAEAAAPAAPAAPAPATEKVEKKPKSQAKKPPAKKAVPEKPKAPPKKSTNFSDTDTDDERGNDSDSKSDE